MVKTPISLTVTTAGYATFFDANNAVVLPEGMTGYVWDTSSDPCFQEVYKSGELVPAGEPIVVKAAAGTYTLTYTTTEDESYKSAGMNALCGAATDMTAAEMATANPGENKFYGLSLAAGGDPSSVGFYWIKEGGAAFDLEAGKSYLVLPKTSARSGFAFNEETEALESIEMNTATTIYTLEGMMVNELQKGLNIVNGKKIMVK